MASDINHVLLVGRLTRDAELKYTQGGMAVARLGLAVNRRKRSGDQWTEEANFFDVVVWGKTAEALSQYLTKGKQIAVDGELRQNRWEQDGQPRSKVEISANNIQLLGGSGGAGAQGGSRPNGQSYSNQGMNQNPYGSAPAQQSYQAQPQAQPRMSSPQEFEDDIPF